MSRPSARRRPTALRLTETDQKFVLYAASVTSLATVVSIYAYKYSRQGIGSEQLLSPATLLCAGLVLCGSGVQRQWFAVKDCSAINRLPKLGDSTAVVLNALSMVLQFLVMQHLGTERALALLLPMGCLLRAQRGGFMARQTHDRIVLFAAVGFSLLSDLLSSNVLSSILIGYLYLGFAYTTTNMSLALEYEKGDLSIWSGLLLICSSSAMSLFSASKSLQFTYLDILVVLGGIASRAWYATQPKAIWISLSFVWPAVVGISAFVGFNITHGVSWSQLATYGTLYYALFVSVKTSGALNSARSSTANSRLSSSKNSHIMYYITEITKDKESRDIFYFLLLNLTFMVVQMLYGIWTNSLGLISDSIHMLFDCLALAVGLVAAVMSKWPASQNHPFGFAKVEIISGFANGIFLVLISISIMIEALERLMEPPEMKTDQLLLISTLGLCVNLVGIFAFNHGHHHGHSHSHGHDHAHDLQEKPEPLPTIHTPKISRTDGTFDHVRGLQSPMPDFSNFAGFDSPQPSSNGFTPGDGSGRSRSQRPSYDSNGEDDRSRSPIRRPGSPLKAIHEPVLADLVELTECTSEQAKAKPSNLHGCDHDLSSPHKTENSSEQQQHHHRDHLAPAQKHAHGRHLSYDLTAEHSHVHNSCESRNHHHHHQHHQHHHDHSEHDHSQPHKHNHDHSHNMEGIFLHILADTLGSGGVIVSTILIRLFGWTGFDPLASIFIAVLIFLSVIPLLKSSFKDLLMTLQDDQEYILREILGEVSLINGVGGIPFIRFWVDGDQKMHGILTIRAGINGDTDVVRQKVRRKLEDGIPNLADVIVQVDRLE